MPLVWREYTHKVDLRILFAYNLVQNHRQPIILFFFFKPWRSLIYWLCLRSAQYLCVSNTLATPTEPQAQRVTAFGQEGHTKRPNALTCFHEASAAFVQAPSPPLVKQAT